MPIKRAGWGTVNSSGGKFTLVVQLVLNAPNNCKAWCLNKVLFLKIGLPDRKRVDKNKGTNNVYNGMKFNFIADLLFDILGNAMDVLSYLFLTYFLSLGGH